MDSFLYSSCLYHLHCICDRLRLACRVICMKTNNIVEWVLKNKPESRNDDKLLMREVWKLQGFHLNDQMFEKFRKSASPESIRRTRQKFQMEGKYKASEEVNEQRYEKFKEARQERMFYG